MNFARGLARLLFRVLFRVEVRGSVETTGNMLVVANHLSNIDPFIFGGFAPGTMFCMAKRELFATRVLAWILAGCNCFPVERGTPDRWALRTSLDVLKQNGRLLIFVEGTRSSGPGMKQAEAGIGFLARRSGAPICPVAVWGTEQALQRGRRLPRRATVTVSYGTPFQLEAGDGRPDDQLIADAIARRIAELLPAPYRGVYS